MRLYQNYQLANLYVFGGTRNMDKLKQIIEQAIPLTENCDIKRSAEIKRRAKLRIDIEELLRDDRATRTYEPPLEYK